MRQSRWLTWSLVLVVMGGLLGCTPRDVARLAPESLVELGPGHLPGKHLPPPAVDTPDVHAAAIVANLQQYSYQRRAVQLADGQIGVQLGPGYIGIVSAYPLIDAGREAETQPGIVAALARLQPAHGLGRVRNRLVPVLMMTEEYQRLADAHMDVFTVPLAGSLELAFGVDQGEMRWLVDQDLARAWGLKPDELRAIAWQNLWADTMTGPTVSGKGSRQLIVYNLQDGFDATRSLLTPYIRWLGLGLQGDVVIAMPTRDVLMVFGSSDPYFVAEMRSRVQEMYWHMGYGLTPALFTLHGDELVPYPSGLMQVPPQARELALRP